MPRLLLIASLLLGCLEAGQGRAAEQANEPEKVRFNRDIRPILSDRCFTCHGPDKGARKADLRLDVRDIAVEIAIEPGDPDSSEMIARVLSKDPDERMPPKASNKKPLKPHEIDLIRRWIAQGAPYEAHWSFIAPRRRAIPEVKDKAWPTQPIDFFVLARLQREGLVPSPEADRATLVRRLYFDLIGLPPAPAEIEAFVADKSPDAYERLVDQLLRSPHFGERLAMYWLDLVRYADTVGYHGDQDHNISPYRDYVIRAFNDNMPFDQFTIEQLAGDLLPGATEDQKIATGYNRVLQTSHEGGVQPGEYLAKYMADRVRNVSGVWMGATMGCAECHDHKFDPYRQRDFYSLGAFFADIQEKGDFKGAGNSLPTQRAPELDVISPIDRAAIGQLEKRIATLRDEQKKVEDGEEQLKQQIAALTAELQQLKKQRRRTMVTVATKPRTVRVLPRGDWLDQSGEVVQPAVPAFMKSELPKDRRATRLDLARWLTAPDHPQTSRVLVNRLWYLYFGVGLSKVLDDSGSQGEWPTHPDLLDWMAVELIESKWNIKHMVKLLVMSSTYRQSSLESDELRQRDPENRLFARQSRFRLPAEMIRDNALSLSGLLVDRIGGRSARPYQPAGYYAHLNFPKRTYKHDADENQYRRAVYTHWQRQFLHPMLKALDAPSREECTAQRPVSNTPLAALALLNDPTFVEAARVFAVRILREGGDSRDARITWAWRQATSRAPQPSEVALIARLRDSQFKVYSADKEAAKALLSTGLAPTPQDIDPAELAAWTFAARALLNLNETITRN